MTKLKIPRTALLTLFVGALRIAICHSVFTAQHVHSLFDLKDALHKCLQQSKKGDCSQSEYGPIELWNVSRVTTMAWLFEEDKLFNADISNWNVAQVVDMSGIFFQAKSFNQDISKWKVSRVTDMSQMFYQATLFNQDISEWNVSHVDDMSGMFFEATSFNQDISKWVVSRVTDMSRMFKMATSFAQKLCGPAWIRSTAKRDEMFLDSPSGSIESTCTTTATATPTPTSPAIIVPVAVIAGVILVITTIVLILVTTMTSISITNPSTVAFNGGNSKSVFVANDEFKINHATPSNNITPTGPVLQQKSGSENQPEAITATGPNQISAAGSTATSLEMAEVSSNNMTMGSSISITSTDPVPLTADSVEPTTTTVGSTHVETTVDPNNLTNSSNLEPLPSDHPIPSAVVVNGGSANPEPLPSDDPNPSTVVVMNGGSAETAFVANDEFKTNHTTTSDNIAPTGPVLATHDDDTATTAPALPSVQKTFVTSNYKRFYERAKPAPFQHNLLAAVHTTVALFATRVNPTLDEAAIEEGVVGFMEDIQDDAFKNDKALKTNVDCVAEYLWTSFKRHDILKRMELCSVLNAVIREDIAEEIEAAASIFRSINSRRVNREDLGPDIDPSYPRYGETWRGGGFRNHCRPFFDSMLGRKYRVSGFLATSSNRRVAAKFAFKADRDHPRALWNIKFDRRGKCLHKYRVQHMSIVTKTLVKGEREYLFAPYSVFKLASVKWSTDLSIPHKLTIEAANDNRAEDEDLPLTPWY